MLKRLSFALRRQSFSKTTTMGSPHTFPGMKSEQEWKASLSAKEFNVLREKGTEMPGTGLTFLLHLYMYVCTMILTHISPSSLQENMTSSSRKKVIFRAVHVPRLSTLQQPNFSLAVAGLHLTSVTKGLW